VGVVFDLDDRHFVDVQNIFHQVNSVQRRHIGSIAKRYYQCPLPRYYYVLYGTARMGTIMRTRNGRIKK